jgi:hypothetical protein
MDLKNLCGPVFFQEIFFSLQPYETISLRLGPAFLCGTFFIKNTRVHKGKTCPADYGIIFVADGPYKAPHHMKPSELKATLRSKAAEFEMAMQAGTPHAELLKLYKELKELQYQLVHAQIRVEAPEDYVQ